MRLVRVLTAVAIVTILSGCWVLSIDPLYTSKDVVFEPSLLGVWMGDDASDSETWTFSTQDSSAYRLTTTEPGRPDAQFEIHLLHLDGRLYMDMLPEEPEDMNQFQLGHLIPGHSFWTVALEPSTFTLNMLDVERVKALIDSAGVKIANLRRDDAVVLTARTDELQAFIKNYVDQLMSDEPLKMNRIK